MRFGTWNVRTLPQAGNMNTIAEEAEKYKMDAVALQEIRWKGKGTIRKSKFTMYYSGNEDRGANSDSDHFLVGARLKQKRALITRNRTENRKRWNIDKLEETEVQCHYQQEIHKELQGKPPSNDIEEEWTHIKEAIITSAQSIIGEKQNETNEEWYDQEC